MKILRNVTVGDKIRLLSAFTLAEVLITLGIIGVVAAITLPTLIQNYQKKTYVEGLKVAVSTFENGFKKAMADDGVDDLRNTELYKFCNWASNKAEPQKCQQMLNRYLKVIKFETENDLKALGDTNGTIEDTAKCKQLVGKANKWWFLNNKTKCLGYIDTTLTFANGMRSNFALYDYNWNVGYIMPDINGSKGPNTWGRDVFRLTFLPNGHVVPHWGREALSAWAKYKNNDVLINK